MTFTELDRKMRVFETVSDSCVLPGIYRVARIDGRNFTRQSKRCTSSKPPSMPLSRPDCRGTKRSG